MNNYVYIIAGLPELILNFDKSTFLYDNAKRYFFDLLSEKDQRLVALFEEGFDDATLGPSFYEKTFACKNRFIRDYFSFDLQLRNMKVIYLAKRLNQLPDKYLIDDDSCMDFEEEKQVQAILDNPNFVVREQQLDQLKWQKATELTRMSYFSIDVILSFLLKAKIVQRWTVLDEAKGKDFFKNLYSEVRGTYKDIDYYKEN